MARMRPAHKWGWAAAMVFVVVTAVIAGLSYGGSSDSDGDDSTVGTGATSTAAPGPAAGNPEAAAEAFLQAWENADWSGLEALVGPGVDQAAAAHRDWWDDLAVSSLQLSLDDVTRGADDAVAAYNVSVGVGDLGVWSYHAELTLQPQDEGWVVVWAPTVLHPSLGPDDRLTVLTSWPERGSILDANGFSLVGEEPFVVIGVVPDRIDTRQELAAALEAHLGVAPSELDGILDAPGVQPDWFLPIRTVDRRDYVDLRPVLYPVPGVVFRVEDGRAVPDGTPGAELIGSTGPITAELLDELGPPYERTSRVGRSGMERSFEAVLAGTPSYQIVRRPAAGDDLVVYEFPGTPAADFTASITVEAQRSAEAVVTETDLPASVVAIDVGTGEIRAAASNPAGGFNEALSGLFPPGSTFKIVVATALLESGMTPDDTVSCPAVVTVSGKDFRNGATLPRSLTLEQAFARSCNTAFIELGINLDPAQLADVAARYGFGDGLDVGLAAAAGSFAPTGDAVDLAASMIGQGRVLASPLQMASVAATAASGQRHEPTMVGGAAGTPTAAFVADVTTGLGRMMRAVVAGGTGTAAAVAGRDVAGKTGTAQVGEGDTATTVAWFVGFSDELAFAVAVEGGASGGEAAAPLAARFLELLDDPASTEGRSAVCVAAGADWPTFQGSGTRAGCSDAAAIEDPEVVWTAEVGIQAWLNTPVVAGDTVIVGSAGTRRAGPDEGDGVYALHLADGSARWRFATDNDVNGVAVDDGLVVVAGDEGAVWGLEAATGTERWKLDTGSPVFGHPAFAGDLVVVGDAGGTLWGVDQQGSVQWAEQLDGAIRGGPATDGKLIYAVSDLGDVRALDRSGFVMWSDRIEFTKEGAPALPIVYGPPTIVDDLLVVTFTVDGGPGSPGAIAFDRYVGGVVWRGSDPAGLSGTPWHNVRGSVAIAGDQLVMAASLSSGPQALAAKSGAAAWLGESLVTCERHWPSPVLMGEAVLLPRPDGAVYAYSAADGSLLWRLEVPTSRPVVTLSGCTSADGSRFSESPAFHASAAVAGDGKVIVASTGRLMYAIAEAR